MGSLQDVLHFPSPSTIFFSRQA